MNLLFFRFIASFNFKPGTSNLKPQTFVMEYRVMGRTGLQLSLAQLSIAWCIKNPHVTTIIFGATVKEQLLENPGSIIAAEKLSDEVMPKIEEIVQTKPKLPEY